MNRIFINGNEFHVEGKSIEVITNNGKTIVKVGGDTITEMTEQQDVTIRFEGDLASLKCHTAVVTGNVTGGLVAHNVECKNVSGDINAHNIICTTVSGSVVGRNINHRSS
jgi:hypothetical protein